MSNRFVLVISNFAEKHQAEAAAAEVLKGHPELVARIGDQRTEMEKSIDEAVAARPAESNAAPEPAPTPSQR